MARHPAGKAHCEGEQAMVRGGDTLWSLAGEAIDTSRASRIARYLPAVIAANRERIADPDVIYPGQRVDLPDPCDL